MTDHKLTPEQWVRTNLQDAVLECRDLTGTRVFVNARMLDVDPVLAELKRLTKERDEARAERDNQLGELMNHAQLSDLSNSFCEDLGELIANFKERDRG